MAIIDETHSKIYHENKEDNNRLTSIFQTT